MLEGVYVCSDSSGKVTWRQAPALAQSPAKPSGKQYVILGLFFGIWREQFRTGGRNPEFQSLFCPKSQM